MSISSDKKASVETIGEGELQTSELITFKQYLRFLMKDDLTVDELTDKFNLSVIKHIVDLCIKTYENKTLEKKITVVGEKKFIVIGDIHGNIEVLRNILHNKPKYTNRLIFLGDYVDRGLNNIEVILLLMVIRIILKDSVILLRGNHEVKGLNLAYSNNGFYQECLKNYGKIPGTEVFNTITRIYDYLPITCIINNTICCVHGGIPVDISAFMSNVKMKAPIDNLYKHIDIFQALWDDPEDSDEYMDLQYKDNKRGKYIMTFGKKALDNFLKATSYKCIIRGHQFDPDEPVFTTPDYKVITVFSSTNYNDTGNDAAFLILDFKDNAVKIDVRYLNFVDSDDTDDLSDIDLSEDEDEDDEEQEIKEAYRIKRDAIRKMKMERELRRSEMMININQTFQYKVEMSHVTDDIREMFD